MWKRMANYGCVENWKRNRLSKIKAQERRGKTERQRRREMKRKRCADGCIFRTRCSAISSMRLTTLQQGHTSVRTEPAYA